MSKLERTSVDVDGGIEARLMSLWPELRIARAVAPGREPPSSRLRHRPDLVFLDLEAPGLNGLQLAQAVAERFEVAFVTAFQSHAVVAFEADGDGYLSLGHDHPDIGVGRLGAAPAAGPLTWITAASGPEISLIRVTDVCYFRADAKYTMVVTADRDFVIRRSISALEKALDRSLFWRIHRSTIVNLASIASVTRDLSGALVIKLGPRPERLAVSESYRRLFRQM